MSTGASDAGLFKEKLIPASHRQARGIDQGQGARGARDAHALAPREGKELSLVVGSESLVLFGDGMESERLTLTWGQSVRVSRAPRALALVDPAGLG